MNLAASFGIFREPRCLFVMSGDVHYQVGGRHILRPFRFRVAKPKYQAHAIKLLRNISMLS